MRNVDKVIGYTVKTAFSINQIIKKSGFTIEELMMTPVQMISHLNYNQDRLKEILEHQRKELEMIQGDPTEEETEIKEDEQEEMSDEDFIRIAVDEDR